MCPRVLCDRGVCVCFGVCLRVLNVPVICMPCAFIYVDYMDGLFPCRCVCPRLWVPIICLDNRDELCGCCVSYVQRKNKYIYIYIRRGIYVY